MVMTNIVSGIVRPSDIARNLGVSRQAIHSTINQMVKLGMVELAPDPDDRRHMIVSLTETGARMRQDAQRAMDQLADQLADRLGHDRFDALLATARGRLGRQQGASPSLDASQAASAAATFASRIAVMSTSDAGSASVSAPLSSKAACALGISTCSGITSVCTVDKILAAGGSDPATRRTD